MKVDVLLGLQWGDEGKGKVVDVLTPSYDVVARFQGGPNAGHTLEFDGRHHVLRSIPSGIFGQHQTCLIGSGVVLDPVLLMQEVDELRQCGVDVEAHLKVSRKAHLIMPTHRLLDAAGEQFKGDSRIGTTGKGIGPAYTDKVRRCGLRVGDIEHDFNKAYQSIRQLHMRLLEAMGQHPDIAQAEQQWMQAVERLRKLDIVDGEYFVAQQLAQGRRVLAEGAQGTMLDVDHGSYPYVTSSSTAAAGACIGLGVAPQRIGEVYGVFKAYCTRVGAGPFPTELANNTGAEMRRVGHEYGAVTGRERRCGWIDLVALRHAILLSGVTQLVMTKSDVLDGFDTICACDAYEIDGGVTHDMPYDIACVRPVYTELPGWRTPLAQATSLQQLPQQFRRYMAWLEERLSVPITIVSVGPDRKQTIKVTN
ncbi:MAG: adenylosuccinate synthase [Muribaculaceae bacterium]|nr:adenylosuccinate synthase [Muribaculaceae bacterium]